MIAVDLLAYQEQLARERMASAGASAAPGRPSEKVDDAPTSFPADAKKNKAGVNANHNLRLAHYKCNNERGDMEITY